MAPSTRNRAFGTSESASTLQEHRKQTKPAMKRELAKRKRALEEGSAEAACQELKWQSGQTSKSGTQAVPMLDKPYAFEDEQDSESDRGDGVEEARNARKRFKSRVTTPMEDDDEYNGSDSDAQFDAELGALKFKMSKRKIGGSSFKASSPALLHSKLPRARPSKSSSQISSALQPSPPVATTAPSTPRRSTSLSRPRMLDQTPVSKAVVKTANCIFRVYVSTENAFPAEDEIAARAHASFKRACKDLNRTETLARFETDPGYASIQAKIVSARPAQIRGELKSKVQRAVFGYYDLHNLSRSRLEMKITSLLCDRAYVFRNPDKREGFFQHPIFSEVFGAQWLRKGGEATTEYAPAFNPVPLQTLALIATAIECALRDYVKGFKEMKRGINHFSSDLYRGTYDSHLSTLQKQEQKHPQLILKLRRDIFQTASNSTTDLSQTENDDYLGDFDLEADMACLANE